MSRVLKRTLKLLHLLQSRHGLSVEYLANALGCSQRTVFRDIKLLNEVDVRIGFNKRLGGYTLERHGFMADPTLDDDELTTLVIAATVSPVSQLRPFSDKVNQAVAKLMHQSPWHLRNHIDRVVAALRPATEPISLSVEEAEVFSALLNAIVGRHVVRIHWNEATEQGQKYAQFSPYQLLVVDGQWFVGGQSADGEMTRIALNEILVVAQTDESYEVPVEDLEHGDTAYRRTDRKQESRVKTRKKDAPSTN